MGKLIRFNVGEGDFQSGFYVALQICEEGEHRSIAEADCRLPPAIELPAHYDCWRECHHKKVRGRSSDRLSVEGSTDRENIAESKEAKKQLHSSFNNWLNPKGDFSDIWTEILKTLKDEDEEIRVIVKTKNKKLQQLPWYIWDEFFDRYRRAEACLYLPVKPKKLATPRDKVRDKVKGLTVFGKREAVGTNTRIGIEEDWEMLERHLSQESNAELIRLDKPTLEELCNKIDEEQWIQFFFYAGHSSNGQIELNDEDPITIDDLKPYLRDAVDRGLQLVIFNSCDGLGIARQLANLDIPNIIVMREPVPDEVAQKFLRRFLEAFANGEPLHVAVRKAREKIYHLESKFPGATWLPMLFQNPAEAPLTWQGLGGVETGKQSDQVLQWNQQVEIVNHQSYIEPEQKSPLTESGNQTNVVNQSYIFCGKCGYKNIAGATFCESCGELLKPEEESPPAGGDTQIKAASPRVATKISRAGSTSVGQILDGHYRILSCLGRGQISSTFLAEDIHRPGHPQCVVTECNCSSNELIWQTVRRLFNTEAKVLEWLGDHDQIPRLLAYFEGNEELYLVREFIDGQDITQELKSDKCLSEYEVVEMLQDTLNILTVVHEKNIIHRNIKPSNLIRRKQDGKLVLIDFGVAKEISQQTFNSQGQMSSGTRIGTPGYMPVEQMQGNPRLNSDIYALGMIAIQALTGVYPFNIPKDDNDREMKWRDRAMVSPQLASIIDKMVRYDYRERYQSATDVIQDLERLNQRIAPKTIAPTTAPKTIAPTTFGYSNNFNVNQMPVIFAFIVTMTVLITTIILIFKTENYQYPIPEKPSPALEQKKLMPLPLHNGRSPVKSSRYNN